MNQDSPLLRYLDPALISVQSDISSAKKLLQQMAHLLAKPLPAQTDENIEKNVYHCLLEREKIGNTGIGNGIALPHCRCADTEKAIIAIITLTRAIDFDSADGQAVDIAFGLLVPEDASQHHLNLLADIARLLSSQGVKDQLVCAGSVDQIIDLITNWSAEQAAV